MSVKLLPYRLGLIFAVSCSLLAVPGVSQQSSPLLRGASFVPDAQFEGSALTGWHKLGHADWTASNGEITGKAGAGDGGWLVLDKSYQDSAIYFTFRCKGSCDTGVLLRMEKTTDGMKGTYLTLKGTNIDAENITLDADGKILQRQSLTRVGSMIRFAPEPTKSGAPVGQRPPVPPSPISKPEPGIHEGEWNEVEVLLDADIIRGFLNEGGNLVTAATGDMYSYGPLALYVGAGSEVSFKNIKYKDIAFKTQPAEEVGKGFRMQRISPFYYNWSADAADFNHDGKLDIVSGAFIYFGPDYTKRREIFPAETSNPSNQYALLIQHAFDYTKDGWPDVLVTNVGSGANGGAFLFVNPQDASRRWKKYKVVPSLQSEESLTKDIDGDGIPELVYVADGYMRYAKPDPANPTGQWIEHNVSEKGTWPAHGIGVGDINGDGRIDVVGAYGWWEHPASGSDDKPWRYHPEAFGRWGRINVGGTIMGVYDVNGDGLNDVVTSLEAHSWGLAWFEQKRSASGEISFVEHMVMDSFNTANSGGVTFAELHGATTADVDGDGLTDFIVGKRVWSHQDDFFDPDPYGPAYLYWYKTVHDPKAPGGARLVPQLVHNSSGAGSDVLAVDLNGDGKMDIVTSTKFGTFIFWGQGEAVKASRAH